MTKEELIGNINLNITLNIKEYEFLELLSQKKEILRKLMSSDEIKMANKLVKLGLIDKGISDAKHGTTTFFINHNGETYLNDRY